MSFPSTPYVGQTYTTPLGVQYVWTDDGAWRSMAGNQPNNGGLVSILLPANTPGYLRNDGSGHLSWDPSVSGGGGGGAGTNLTLGTISGTSITVLSDTGTDVVLPQATNTTAGLFSAEDKVTLATHTYNQSKLIELSGVATGSGHLGAFSGSTIPDNLTIKSAFQALESSLESTLEASFGYTPQMFGAVADGTTDCTAGIQAALDAAKADGTNLVRFPPGDYYLSAAGVLRPGEDKIRGLVKLRTNVNVIGYSARILVSGGRVDGPGVFYHAYWDDDEPRLDNVEISGITFVGNSHLNTYDPSYEYQYGIQIMNGVNCHVHNCKFMDFRGDGVAFGRSFSEIDNSQLVSGSSVHSCEFVDIWREGVFCCAVDGVAIFNNYFHGDGYYVGAIDIERHTTFETVRNVEVYGNTFDFTDGFHSRNVTKNTRRAITVSFFYDNYDSDTVDGRFRNINISNNTIRQGMIDVWGATDVVIANNHMVLAYEDQTGSTRISANTIHVDDADDLGTTGLKNLVISGNTVDSGMDNAGIYVKGYDNFKIIGNDVRNTRHSGIAVLAGSGVIQGNTVVDTGQVSPNLGNGIVVGDECWPITISGNQGGNFQASWRMDAFIKQLNYSSYGPLIVTGNAAQEVNDVFKSSPDQLNYHLAYGNMNSDGIFSIKQTVSAYDIVGLNSVEAGDGTSGVSIRLHGSATSNRVLRFQTGLLKRWEVMANDNAESGSNSGSDFRITRYDDAGTAIDSPVSINRDNGQFKIIGTWGSPLIMNDVYLWVSSGKLWINTSAPANATDGTIVGTQT